MDATLKVKPISYFTFQMSMFFFLTNTFASISREEYGIAPAYLWKIGLPIGFVVVIIIVLIFLWKRQVRRLEEAVVGGENAEEDEKRYEDDQCERCRVGKESVEEPPHD